MIHFCSYYIFSLSIYHAMLQLKDLVQIVPFCFYSIQMTFNGFLMIPNASKSSVPIHPMHYALIHTQTQTYMHCIFTKFETTFCYMVCVCVCFSFCSRSFMNLSNVIIFAMREWEAMFKIKLYWIQWTYNIKFQPFSKSSFCFASAVSPTIRQQQQIQNILLMVSIVLRANFNCHSLF